MYLKVFPSGPIDTNAILVACPKKKVAIIIDPAFGSAPHFLERAKKEGFSFQGIYLTHSHWDHIGDLKMLKEKLHLPVFVHKDDAEYVEHPPKRFCPLEIEGVVPDHYLKDGEIISVGDLTFKVIHTPGHSLGSVCFYFEKEKVLISGDTLFKGTIGRVDLPTSDPTLMWRSLKKLSELPHDTQVFPGHGDETTIGAEQWIKNAKERFI